MIIQHGEGVADAYRTLGLEPGVSPLAARRRYRELVRRWHPDHHPPGSSEQAEANRQTQRLNDAYRIVKNATIHTDIPLRQPRPNPAAGRPMVTLFETTTAADRVVTGMAGVFLGMVVDFAFLSDSATIWLALPALLGTCGAVLGWRPLGIVLRALMRGRFV